jgi:hypothetical protein
VSEQYRARIYVYFKVGPGECQRCNWALRYVFADSATFRAVADSVSHSSPGYSPLDIEACRFGLGSDGNFTYGPNDAIPAEVLCEGMELSMSVPFTYADYQRSYAANFGSDGTDSA